MKKFLTLIFIVIIIVVGTVYYFITQNFQEKNEIGKNIQFLSATEGKTDIDTVWCGTFQLAWNELKNYVGGNVEFVDEENELVNNLNNNNFKKEMLTDEDYYLKVAKNSVDLKEKILNDLNKKFNIKETSILNNLNFSDTNGIFIYSMLNKEFHYPQKFESLNENIFTDKDGKESIVRYFGKDYKNHSKYKDNVEILFYNLETYAVKLNTKEDEEVILYLTDEIESKSFDELYNEISSFSKEYKEDKILDKEDILKIPYINLNCMINYEELCNKYIVGRETEYITNAVQNISFILNETGGKVKSEAAIKTTMMSSAPMSAKMFDFTRPFVIFIKEKDKENPYFKAKILDTTFLEEN